MGIVIAAFDERLGRPLALKLLAPSRADSEPQRHRFLREARAAAKIESEHVVRVYDAGVFEDAGAYVAMERLEGMDLRQALDERGRFPLVEAIEILLETCRGVAAAHAEGVIHRDLKPSNLFLVKSPGGRGVKILDFGISKSMSEEGGATQGSLTDTGSAVGSPRYMSPEQVRDAKRVGPASDIWALGVIFYELLTGTTPFVADTAPGIYARIIADPPRPLRELRPDVPGSLEAICMRCLEKRSGARYSNVAMLASALASFTQWDDETWKAAALVESRAAGTDATLDPTPSPLTHTPANESTSSRRRFVAIGAVASCCAFVALAALIMRTPKVVSSHADVVGNGGSDPSISPLIDTPTRPAPAGSVSPSAPDLTATAEPSAAPAPPAERSRLARRVVQEQARPTPSVSVPGPSAMSTCAPPFVIDPTTGTRRVKPGC